MAPKSIITVHYKAPKSNKNCYTVAIFGQSILTTVTTDRNAVKEWIDGVKKQYPRRYFGFEVEFDIQAKRIGTVQLCFPDRCLVFQLLNTSVALPPPLLEFISDKNNLFVSTDVAPKIYLLRAQFPFEATVKGLDVCAKTPFVRDLKQKELGSMALGVVETCWDRLPQELSNEQVHYACLDAFLNLHLAIGLLRYS